MCSEVRKNLECFDRSLKKAVFSFYFCDISASFTTGEKFSRLFFVHLYALPTYRLKLLIMRKINKM